MDYKDRYRGISVRFTPEEWESLDKRFRAIVESLKIKVSKHKFIKSCIEAGLEDISSSLGKVQVK